VAGLKTVEKALRTLLCFTEERGQWSLTELSRELGMHKTVVSRILGTLQEHGFVARDPATKRYRLGTAVVELGRVALGNYELRRVSLPVMSAVVEATGESAFLTVVAGVEAVCLEKVESRSSVRVSYEVGRRTPLHAGASAKILLAYMPDDEVRRVVGVRGLPRYTPSTPVDLNVLVGALEDIRRRGYAFSVGELDEGVSALAVPIRNGRGDVAGSLSIAGPASRLREERVPELLEVLREGSASITEGLGPGRPA